MLVPGAALLQQVPLLLLLSEDDLVAVDEVEQVVQLGCLPHCVLHEHVTYLQVQEWKIPLIRYATICRMD